MILLAMLIIESSTWIAMVNRCVEESGQESPLFFGGQPLRPVILGRGLIREAYEKLGLDHPG
jgi:hypothetical protein